MSSTFYLLSLTVLLFFSTCAYTQEEEEEVVPVTPESQKRILQENVYAQTQGNSKLAVELYYRLATTPGNLFFSPFSLSSAFLMPYIGSKGATHAQIQQVMHYLSADQNLYDTFSWFNKYLSASWMTGPNETRLFLANSLWIQNDLKILYKFLETSTKQLGFDTRQVDFKRNLASASLNINEWVREKTGGRIAEIIGPDALDSQTKLVVISAIFMKAVWRHAFDPALTTNMPFFVANNKTIAVPMMTTTALFPIYQTRDYTVIDLPYREGEVTHPQLSFLLFLPQETFGLSLVEPQILATSVDSFLKNLESHPVILSLPKFKISQELTLSRIFQKLGLFLPFSTAADFSEITGKADLMINDVIHQAFLSVDEKGTEAVAATAISIGMKSMPAASPFIFKADHPFMFMIIDRKTRSILFMGRCVNPE